jgi:diguanylate cyclase (GGDEF)-like protein
VNLDRFHQVNAGLGHAAGDRILREAGRRLRAQLRGDDTVARLGGDEFAVLAPAMRTPLDAVAMAIDVRNSLAKPYWIDGNAVYVSARVGIVTDVHDVDAEGMVQMASSAALHAKSLAGGWSLHTAGSDMSGRDELGLVCDLRQAIADGSLTVAYQPVVDGTGSLCHVEALARWNHPDRGAVPPDQFIVLAEQNDLISDLTEHVLTTAVRQTASWRASGLDACVAVNLSGLLLADAGLAERITGTLERAGLPPEALTLEITETAFADGSSPLIRAALESLRSIGVRISIDDFGTGYSSLAYLKHLPVDELKIDRSFILDLDTDVRTEQIVRSIIDLAHSLGLTVVAEGVEDEQIAAGLTAMGADALQGYIIARPAGATATAAWMRAHPTAPEHRHPQDELRPRRELNVLIVDSLPTDRKALRRRLRVNQHRVRQAHSCGAAVSSVKRRMPDVVILDHLMPGTTGVETAPRLREAGYAGPILLFSGSAPNNTVAARFPMDVWPVSADDDALLVGLIDGYAGITSPRPPRAAAVLVAN